MSLEGNAAVLYDVDDNPISENPGSAKPASALQIAGNDGTDLQALLTDSAGRQRAVGAAADGAAVVGDPVLLAGSDGTNVRTLKTLDDGTVVTSATAGKASTATLVNVVSLASSATLLALNTDRLGVLVHNESNKSLNLKYGATASASSYSVRIPARGSWEMPEPIYTGIIDGIWDAANGFARITELET